MFTVDYKSGKPIHEQICIGIKEMIISGIIPADEKLPSVREMAVSLTVNPNTVQHAYKALEADGFIYSVPGKGSFASDTENKNHSRIDFLYKEIERAVKELAYSGEPESSITNIVKNIYGERNGYDDKC